ncbi:hypothetical protein NicSoilB4_27710 [Arthrobacter sp. NicSoilB4]|nr:hypothetical protein NicSoilB4_27710 [Arthrobacter sp. NicSoilB4]
MLERPDSLDRQGWPVWPGRWRSIGRRRRVGRRHRLRGSLAVPPALHVSRTETRRERLAVRVTGTTAFPCPPPAEAQQEGSRDQEYYQQWVDSSRHGHPS